MWKYIKILLLALVFGMGYQPIDSATAKGYPMAQDQSYACSDAGVPVCAVINYTAETLVIVKPDHLNPWINDGARLMQILTAETTEIRYDFEMPVFRIRLRYNFPITYQDPYIDAIPTYKDTHHNYC